MSRTADSSCNKPNSYQNIFDDQSYCWKRNRGFVISEIGAQKYQYKLHSLATVVSFLFRWLWMTNQGGDGGSVCASVNQHVCMRVTLLVHTSNWKTYQYCLNSIRKQGIVFQVSNYKHKSFSYHDELVYSVITSTATTILAH